MLDRGFSVLVSPYDYHRNHAPFVPEILLVFCGIQPYLLELIFISLEPISNVSFSNGIFLFYPKQQDCTSGSSNASADTFHSVS